MEHKKPAFFGTETGRVNMAVELFAYKNRSSILHKIPALLKLAVTLVFCIFCFNVPEAQAINLFFYLAVCAVLFFLGKCNFRTLRSLCFVIFLGAFVTVLRMFSFIPHFEFKIEEFFSGLIYSAKLFLSALICQIIFETTSSSKIQQALETLEDCVSKIIPPVKKLHFALLISLTINFIPMVFETWNKIELSCKARTPKKRSITMTMTIMFVQLSALFSCLLFKAETKRKAIINRGNYD